MHIDICVDLVTAVSRARLRRKWKELILGEIDVMAVNEKESRQ